jgi:transcriptional regulator with XRE-family HTH domain
MGIIDFIKEQVKSHGLTLSELSKRTGIDSAYLSRILNKHISPSADIVDLLLAAVNISCDSLLKNVQTAGELVGEVKSLIGTVEEKKPKKLSMHPNGATFILMIKSPPLMEGLDFPNGYFMVFSKDKSARSGDTAFVVYKEGKSIKKIVRILHYKGPKAVLSTVFPGVHDIVVPKKDIINTYKMIRLLKNF